MEKIPIDLEFNCVGYFGFGSGVSISRSMTALDKVGFTAPHSKEGYCNKCPLSAKCWDKHREKVKSVVPELAEYIDYICREPSKKEYQKFMNSGGADPYLSIMMGNLQDGATVVATGKPVNRGEMTLPYPFKK